ncbi:outer membrane lipoprotein chaperone LolA [Snodgrassella sp. CFCC 13594]|uniref:outer membrane lipoprotein chaperone LolA n=1 Tax=Snodgrassella sp. CFCC 13594 TaxID=1775559 RepID=UPI00082AC203|nr:outer membrane lipoprotein chaperone LolA [Snodgrassella sp. CFCC 13594]
MTLKQLSKTFAAAALSAGIGMTHADGIAALQKFNTDTDGISGQFSQTVHSKKKTQTTSGQFSILRPGLFKWEYTRPYKQTIVGDGKTIWLYDQDLKQVTKRAQNQTIGDSPAAILSNKSALNASYTLKNDGASSGVDYVRATPKRNNAGYRYIRIGFRGNTLATMQLQDSFGNNTNIQFSGVNTRPNLSRGQFHFTPPKGVDVLGQ